MAEKFKSGDVVKVLGPEFVAANWNKGPPIVIVEVARHAITNDEIPYYKVKQHCTYGIFHESELAHV